ncbi:hypothetical protein [Streptomyces bugieae]|uniref:Uncharacterized protein n=1 Tax=Streptomyces bugieae TaxID=3098223 RepID=A0ABU7P1K2_9ACTN|nr:hypothetical protein [Streptomyces sp. DSM 41528]
MYGEDPYGGAGYSYAYGHEPAHGHEPAYGHESAYGHEPAHGHEPAYGHESAYGHEPAHGHESAYGDAYGGGVTGATGVTTGTAPPAWNEASPAPWTHRTAQATTAWDDSPHGDVLTAELPVFGTDQLPVADTAQLPVFDAPDHPVPAPDAPQSETARPVFVDSSGRRQRRVLRAARLLVIPAGGYVAVLISTMLGGPSISSPFVPHADSAHPARPTATAPDPSPGTGHPARSASPTATNSGTAARKTPGPTGRPTASAGPVAPSRPTAAPTTTAAPTRAAAPAPRGRALGSSHKPVK